METQTLTRTLTHKRFVLYSKAFRQTDMTSVISRSDLDRIRQVAKGIINANDTTSKVNALMTKRQQLKQMSLDKVQHWPNTLEASRNKKEMLIKDKLQREELDRLELDKQVS